MREAQIIPDEVTARYQSTLKDFVLTLQRAIASATEPAQAAVWKEKLLPLLELRAAAAENAMAHHSIGDPKPLTVLAQDSLSLARDLDGHSLHFAGAAFAGQLEEKLRFIVLAAGRVCESAGAM